MQSLPRRLGGVEKSDARITRDDKHAVMTVLYTGTLEWVEPFATQKPQTLKLDIQTWIRNDRSFIFACV
jgi:hypothetical protein